MIPTRRTLTMLVLLGTALLAAPAGASADEVECGDLITEDTTLTADVVCAEGDPVAAPDGWPTFALLIAADGVKLDLNGHQVGSDWDQGIGTVGRSGVTGEGNGGFTYEVRFRDTTDSLITGVRAGWIGLTGADHNRVTHIDGGIGLYEAPTTTPWSTTTRARRAEA
jgi:hypothetical protein